MADRGRRQSGSNDMDRSRSGSFRRSMRRRSRSLQSSAASETDEMDEWGKTKSDRAQLITEFKTILAADNIYDDKKHDDHMLLRYLRARKYNLQLAKAMWKDSLEWRREFGTDTILEDFDFHERKEFLQVYPQGYHMTDKKGRPIYIQHLGAINLPKIEQVTTIERMVKFHVQEYERCIKEIMPACSAAAGRHIDQSFVILDVKGVGPRLLTGNVRKVITSITKIDQDNYPEMLGKTCIINAPTVFRMVWAVVRSMLDPRTVSKIEICGTNYLPTLRKYCAAENLPKYLGGLSSATLIDDVGPWNRKPAPEYGLDALHEAGEDSASVHESGPFSVQDLKESQKLKVEQLGLQGDGGLPGPMPISLPGKRRSSRGTPLQEKRKSSLKSPRRTIAERLQALEAAVPLQSEKLRQHLPAQSAALAAPPTPGTPSGSVLGRLEALEQAMVVLLAAQDAQLAERQGAEKESGPAAVQQQGRESPAVLQGSRTSSRRASEVGVVEQPPLEQASWGCMPCSVM